jgi:hypothetical protein
MSDIPSRSIKLRYDIDAYAEENAQMILELHKAYSEKSKPPAPPVDEYR